VNPISKIILNVIGTFFVILGILGVFLPLLPTTVFLLLASACYIRGSDRLYKWLINNKFLGKYIKDFQEKKAMPLKAKILSISLMWISIAFSIYKIDNLILKFILLFIGIIGTIVVLRIRTLKYNEEQNSGYML
jgi:uncharacterized membrane protein YbaN (DUF454 family)